MAATTLLPGHRTRLPCDDGSVYLLMDAAGINLYCVTPSTRSYPERLAYQLLHDVLAVAMEEHSMASVGECGALRS